MNKKEKLQAGGSFSFPRNPNSGQAVKLFTPSKGHLFV